MPAAAIIGGVASIGSALIGANAAKKAAKQQVRGAERAREDIQQQMLPFSRPGQGAMASLAQLYGIDPATGEVTGEAFGPGALEAFRRSPDYQFALQEGLGAVERSNAGRGMLKSGNTLRDLTTFGQGWATQTLGNYRGALENLARIGAGAAGGAASGLGSAAMHAGTAQASGTVGAANALSGALGNIGNYAMLQSALNQLKPTQSIYSGAAAPYNAIFNPTGYSSVLPGGIGAFPY